MLDFFEEEVDGQRKKRLLDILAVGIGAIDIIAIIGVTFLIRISSEYPISLYAVLWSAIGFLVGVLVVLWLNHQGRGLLASILFLGVMILSLTFASGDALKQGATQFYFIIPVLIASVIIRPSASFYVAMVNSLVFAVAVLAYDIESRFFIGIFGMFGIAFVSWLSARILEDALNGLRRVNIELDKRVEQRTKELAQANISLENQAQELAKANQRLQGLDELKSKLVSDVSHELLTPISNLSIYLEMLEEGDPKKTLRYRSVLREEAKRLEKLVSNILDLSRMENGTTAMEFQVRDVDGIIRQVVLANQLRAEAKGLELKYHPKVKTLNIPVIEKQLTRALSNLVDNAVNYTEAGEVIVSTSLNDAKEQIIIEVSDTGMGINKEDAEHVFDRFYRGRQASQSTLPGTGLGLAITKEIVERHGGSIHLQSKVGKGSTFTVYLPINIAEIG